MQNNHLGSAELFSKLHDIHMVKYSIWDFSYIFLLLVCAVFIILIIRWYKITKYQRKAFKALKKYEKDWQDVKIDSSKLAQLIITTWRNFALRYYPKKDIAGLHSERLIYFLNTNLKKSKIAINFDNYVYEITELPYILESNIDITDFLNAIRLWIKNTRGPYV